MQRTILFFAIGLFILTALSCTNKDERFVVLFAGDLMLDRGVRNVIERRGAEYLFKGVGPILAQADAAVANFEGTACDTALPPANKLFVFNTKPEWLGALRRNGLTHVTLANNHSADFGAEGLRQTAENLSKYGLGTIGTGTTACKPVVMEKGKQHIAVFSACFLSGNISLVCGDMPQLLANIASFKQAHPNYLVFVCLHWGVEMARLPTLAQRKQAYKLIEAGADAIIGHHPHVVQTIEKYKEKYIFYSLGNFIFDNRLALASQGLLATYTWGEQGNLAVRIFPFLIVNGQPQPMYLKASENFITEIGAISPTIHFEPEGESWILQ